MIEFKVSKNFTNTRIDKYLVSQNHKDLFSRNLIDKLIISGKVFINSDNKFKKSYLVQENDLIMVDLEILSEENKNCLEKENIPIDIVYEDDFMAVINKKAGITVHPAPGNKNGTLVNALLFHFHEKLSTINKNSENEEFPRPGIVHRLDKDTSGLIIIAKDDKTHFELSKLFMNRLIKKKYLCLCLGVPNPLSGEINFPISRHKTDRKKMSACPQGREALSSYKTLIDFDYFSLLEVEIHTGRTHQIRVHLEANNHPVLGDIVYNSLKRTLACCPLNHQKTLKQYLVKNLNRQALHAWKLSFVHPILKSEVNLTTPLPEDIKKVIIFLQNQFNYYIVDKQADDILKGVL